MELDLLKKIIADVLSVDPDEITPDVYQIIMAVEDELGIEVNEEDAEKISTVGDAVELISKTKGED